MNKIQNYSPNFKFPKRSKKIIKFIVLHYTGMKREISAIRRLQDHRSKVSSHYLIKNNGDILILVPDLYEAWHAGFSSWKNFRLLNKNSIGIEITNPGHQYGYKNFSTKQILSLIKLLRHLMKKYKIKKEYVLGHSDISPERKKDPGEKFPWKKLSKFKIGSWYKEKKIKRKLKNKMIKSEFFSNLHKIGYRYFDILKRGKKDKLIVKAFQSRYCPNRVSGNIDEITFQISHFLTKN